MFSLKRLVLGLVLALACMAPAAAQFTGPFNPATQNSFSVNTTSSNIAIGAGVSQILVVNTGQQTAYVQFGSATLTTTPGAGMPIGPGCSAALAPYGAPYLAAVTQTGSTTLLFDTGYGTITLPPSGCATTLSQMNPSGSTQEEISASGANAIETATLPAQTGYTEYVCGATFSASGATAGFAVAPTITGLTNTLTFAFDFPAGVLVGAQPLNLAFSPCIPASAANTAINAILPAGGAGNTQESATIWGYYK